MVIDREKARPANRSGLSLSGLIMSQPLRQPIRRRQLEILSGPLLPGEFRPLAPVPAASEPSDPPPLTEAQCIACLVKHYRWAHIGESQLRRYNPHGRRVVSEALALIDAGMA